MLSFFDMRSYILLLFSVFLSCSFQDQKSQPAGFILLDRDQTNIDFRNDLTMSEELNTYTYRNFYNGAGVAIGDINQDGLADIYFCGNMVDNKLYLNLGNFKFKDITGEAGVACPNVWSTGANMVDINGDGWLDIYVCKSGPPGGPNRQNQLFINNQDRTFREEAEKWGINDEGLSTHAAFFDFDNDGDLDMYLLNNSLRSIGAYDLQDGQRNKRDTLGGNKLYRNDGSQFTDVSEQAGIYGSAIGFGLGVTISDINLDGWMDIYVSNDFFEKDYLYINQRDGTFKESIENLTKEISMGSMGADIADINNDGWPDIYVTEMLPETWARVKTKTPFEKWDKYVANISNGYFRQFTRNTLQLNTGLLPDGEINFQEISRYTGLHATDWSWGALIADFTNSGDKDIVVANGIGKDLTDHDYINFYANNSLSFAYSQRDSSMLTRLISEMPSSPLPNYFFMNEGDLNFTNASGDVGFNVPSFSNGAAYGDLDNDGKLDLVFNNIDQDPFIYKNDFPASGNYLQIKIIGKGKNTAGIGTKVTVYDSSKLIYTEHNPVKGYLSSMDHILHIGLGKISKIDSLEIIWPLGGRTILKDVTVNQRLELKESLMERNEPMKLSDDSQVLFTEIKENVLINNPHKESDYIDFDRERLLFWMRSNEGPKLAVGKSSDDSPLIFLPGSKGNEGNLMTLGSKLKYKGDFEPFVLSEESAALFFDADDDGDDDLFVASGGNEHAPGLPYWRDRLYINNGDFTFSYFEEGLPDIRESVSFVEPIDFNQDGFLDLVLGIREKPFAYGIPCGLILLQNNGDLTFSDVTLELLPTNEFGMITSGKVIDMNGDGVDDVLLAGEWMPVTLLIRQDGKFIDKTNEFGLGKSHGLWNTIDAADVNGDGVPDIFGGNHGLNSRFKATDKFPLEMNVNDYDANGSVEHVVTQYENGISYPVVLLNDLLKQIPSLKKKYIKHADYQDQTLTDLFSADVLAKSIHHQVYELSSGVFLSKEKTDQVVFDFSALPMQVQLSPIYTLAVEDLNSDGNLDIVFGGNQSKVKPEMGAFHSGMWGVLLGDTDGQFNFLPPGRSGLYGTDELRSIRFFDLKGERMMVLGINDKSIKLYKINKQD